MPFFFQQHIQMMQNTQDQLSVKEPNSIPLFMAFTKYFWHDIFKVNCLKWDQILHHLSPSTVGRGGQNSSLFIYQLSLLINYRLLFLSGTTDVTTSYWQDNCLLRSSNWSYVAYQRKTNSAFILILRQQGPHWWQWCVEATLYDARVMWIIHLCMSFPVS